MQRDEEELKRLVDEINYLPVRVLFDKLSGGKRLRAKLVMKIAKNSDQAPLLGAIIELIHAASLLHDDVIDEAKTRRGKVSINATQGSKIAVMLGDILYSKAFSELVKFDTKIADMVSTSVTSLSVGEMMDVELSKEFNTDESLYMDMLYLKTATLIEAAASSSAYLVNKDVEKYALYGKNLGLSFQIVDDILDIVSDEKTLGKPAMNDFVEGKSTLPYIYIYNKMDEDEKAKLQTLHKKVLDNDETLWIQDMMKKYNGIEQAYGIAKKLSSEAIKAVDGDEALIEIIEKMIQRSY